MPDQGVVSTTPTFRLILSGQLDKLGNIKTQLLNLEALVDVISFVPSTPANDIGGKLAGAQTVDNVAMAIEEVNRQLYSIEKQITILLNRLVAAVG